MTGKKNSPEEAPISIQGVEVTGSEKFPQPEGSTMIVYDLNDTPLPKAEKASGEFADQVGKKAMSPEAIAKSAMEGSTKGGGHAR